MLVDVAMQAIANLSVNARVAKAVADEGGITILTNLAQSMNRLVAEEAAGGLWNLSVGEDHKVVVLQMLTQNFLTIACGTFGNNSLNIFFFQTAIAASGGIKALVDLIFRWPAGTDGVLVWILQSLNI
jgi:hypothetical protein